MKIKYKINQCYLCFYYLLSVRVDVIAVGWTPPLALGMLQWTRGSGQPTAGTRGRHHRQRQQGKYRVKE